MENRKNVSVLFMSLTVFYTLCVVLSNLVAGKMWALFPSVSLPSAILLFPLTYILGDVFTEVYGFNRAKTVIWLGFGASFFSVLVYIVILALPHPDVWTAQASYAAVLGTAPRVALASFIAYLVGSFSNSVLLSRLKVKTKGRKLWLRTTASTVIGEGLDSFVFIFVAFFGTMSNGALFQLMLYQYLFKVTYEILFTPFTYLVVRAVKKYDGVNAFDDNVKYNIFKG